MKFEIFTKLRIIHNFKKIIVSTLPNIFVSKFCPISNFKKVIVEMIEYLSGMQHYCNFQNSSPLFEASDVLVYLI